MDEGWPRPGAESEYRRRNERPFMRRPDRIALWAVGIAVVGMIAAAASAHGATGGAGTKHFTHPDDIHAAPITK
jgi:hypothetical protein